MTEDEMRDLVNQCGLDWQRGYKQYYYNPPRHRYRDLIEATINKTVEEIATMFDIPSEIHGEAEDWSRAAAAKIREAVRSMDRT